MDETFNAAAQLVLDCGSPAGAHQDSRWTKRTSPTVLDIGAGECDWLTRLSYAYPDAHFHAIDPLPRPALLAANVAYHMRPASPLPFVDGSVDLIHARKLLSSLSQEGALANLVLEAARCLRPGGLVVFVEGRNAAPTGTAKSAQGFLVRNLARSHLARSGIGSADTPLSVALPALLRTNGFREIREESLGHATSLTKGVEVILDRPKEDQAAMIVIWAKKG